MKVGIDSYCYHRYFGEIHPDQEHPGVRWRSQDFLNRCPRECERIPGRERLLPSRSFALLGAMVPCTLLRAPVTIEKLCVGTILT